MKFTCATEAFGASDAQWCRLARDSFIVYGGGHLAEIRPRATFRHPVLTIPFIDRDEYLDYVMQARQMNPTRLINFRVTSRNAREVICTSTFNMTPVLRVNGDVSNLPPAPGGRVVIQM